MCPKQNHVLQILTSQEAAAVHGGHTVAIVDAFDFGLLADRFNGQCITNAFDFGLLATKFNGDLSLNGRHSGA